MSSTRDPSPGGRGEVGGTLGGRARRSGILYVFVGPRPRLLRHLPPTGVWTRAVLVSLFVLRRLGSLSDHRCNQN